MYKGSCVKPAIAFAANSVKGDRSSNKVSAMPLSVLPRFRSALAAFALISAPLSALAQGWPGFPVAVQTAPAPGSVHVANTPRGLNVRSGPGTVYPRIGVLPRGQGGQVAGCEASGRWCALSFPGGGQGWVYMPLTRPAALPARLGPTVDWRRLYRTDVPYVHTGKGRVNLRQGAGTHRTIVGKLYPGQGGLVRGCSADARWCLLSVPPYGTEGWVYMPLMKPLTGRAF